MCEHALAVSFLFATTGQDVEYLNYFWPFACANTKFSTYLKGQEQIRIYCFCTIHRVVTHRYINNVIILPRRPNCSLNLSPKCVPREFFSTPTYYECRCSYSFVRLGSPTTHDISDDHVRASKKVEARRLMFVHIE